MAAGPPIDRVEIEMMNDGYLTSNSTVLRPFVWMPELRPNDIITSANIKCNYRKLCVHRIMTELKHVFCVFWTDLSKPTTINSMEALRYSAFSLVNLRNLEMRESFLFSLRLQVVVSIVT